MEFKKTKIIIATILIGAIIIIAVLYSQNRKGNTNKNNINGLEEISNDSNGEKDTYKIGETGTIDGVKVTINKVENYTDESQKAKDGNKFIKVNVKIENTNNADRGIVISDFQCLASNKKASIVNINAQDRLKSSTVGANKTISGDIYYEVDASANNYEIDYNYDDLSGLVLKFSI